MTPFDGYPAWARTLAHGIRARLANTFVLHGNTFDVVAVPKSDAEVRTAADFVPFGTQRADLLRRLRLVAQIMIASVVTPGDDRIARRAWSCLRG